MLENERNGGKLTVFLKGSLDTSNTADIERQIRAALSEESCTSLVLDCDELNYCSSTGLRAILRFKKEIEDTSIVNVHSQLYEVFEMTGFTDMMQVHKAYRILSVEDCPLIGQGANSRVYRLDSETVVKVYSNGDALSEINRERELARKAFIAGVPTAIPYDVVRIRGGGFGSVYELLNAENLADLLINGIKTVDEVAELSVNLIRSIHSKLTPEGSLPDMKSRALQWALFLKDHLPHSICDRLYALLDAVPDDMHMLHGDFHLKNILYQNGECLLIDMDTICHGHPIFELAGMYNTYVGYGAVDRSYQEDFTGIPYEQSVALWQKSLRLYLGNEDAKRFAQVESKARIIGLARIMRRELRRNALERESGRHMIEYCSRALADLLPVTDTLVF